MKNGKSISKTFNASNQISRRMINLFHKKTASRGMFIHRLRCLLKLITFVRVAASVKNEIFLLKAKQQKGNSWSQGCFINSKLLQFIIKIFVRNRDFWTSSCFICRRTKHFASSYWYKQSKLSARGGDNFFRRRSVQWFWVWHRRYQTLVFWTRNRSTHILNQNDQRIAYSCSDRRKA